MKLAPIHIRSVYKEVDKQHADRYDYVYIFGKYKGKYDGYPENLLPYFSDVYGVPSSIDFENVEQVTAGVYIHSKSLPYSPQHYCTCFSRFFIHY